MVISRSLPRGFKSFVVDNGFPPPVSYDFLKGSGVPTFAKLVKICAPTLLEIPFVMFDAGTCRTFNIHV
jgi:hypothetical protein